MATLSENIEFFKLRLQSQPDSLLFARLADYLRQNGEIDKAIEVCESGLKIHPYYVTAHFILAKCLLDKKQYDQALNEFKRVINFDPKFLAAHKYHAEIMEHIGWDNALENSYQQILEIDPYDMEVQSKLEQLLTQKGNEAGFDNENMPFDEQFEVDEFADDLLESDSEANEEPQTAIFAKESIDILEDDEDVDMESTKAFLGEDDAEVDMEATKAFIGEDIPDENFSDDEFDSDDLMPDDLQFTENEMEPEKADAAEFGNVAPDANLETADNIPSDTAKKADEPTETPSQELRIGEEIASEQIFEAVIEEEPPSAEDEEKFSYILDDIFREDDSEEESIESPAANSTNEFDFLGKIEADENSEPDITPRNGIVPQIEPESEYSTDEEPELDFSPEEDDEDSLELAADGLDDIFREATPEDDDFPPMIDDTAEEPEEPERTSTVTPRSTGDESGLFERIRDFAEDEPESASPEDLSNKIEKINIEQKISQKEDEEQKVPYEPEPEPTQTTTHRRKEKIVTPTLGEIYSAQGQYAKAIGVFEILRKKEPNNPAYVEKIKFLKRKMAELNNPQ